MSAATLAASFLVKSFVPVPKDEAAEETKVKSTGFDKITEAGLFDKVTDSIFGKSCIVVPAESPKAKTAEEKEAPVSQAGAVEIPQSKLGELLAEKLKSKEAQEKSPEAELGKSLTQKLSAPAEDIGAADLLSALIALSESLVMSDYASVKKALSKIEEFNAAKTFDGAFQVLERIAKASPSANMEETVGLAMMVQGENLKKFQAAVDAAEAGNVTAIVAVLKSLHGVPGEAFASATFDETAVKFVAKEEPKASDAAQAAAPVEVVHPKVSVGETKVVIEGFEPASGEQSAPQDSAPQEQAPTGLADAMVRANQRRANQRRGGNNNR